jgi:hypothetical protein
MLSFALFIASCSVSYTFTGADIPAEAKTVSVGYFNTGRGATLAPPSTSDLFTDNMNAIMLTQTNLDVISKDGDLQFTGYIDGYTNTPVAAQSNTETSNRNRLTIIVKVNYTNTIDPDKSFEEKAFSQFADFDANENLADIETELQEEIFQAIIQDIFNASLGSW